MAIRLRIAQWKRTALFAAVVAALGLVNLVGTPGGALAAGTLPCDIYGSAYTPCVAAHSTTRALFGSYGGRLYQVRRASDGGTRDIGVLGVAGTPTPVRRTRSARAPPASSRSSTTRRPGTTT